MAQYAVIIYERETAEGGAAEIPDDVMAAHMALPGRIVEAGGREIAGLALEPTATATSIRDGVITDGPFIEAKEAIAGLFVIEARDLDHAISLAAMTPIMDGGVEVRPLIGLQIAEGGEAGT